MFKAIFELSASRAEFIERLFGLAAPTRPPPRDAPIHDLWLPYLNARPDSILADRIFIAIRNHLTTTHNFALSAADTTSLAYLHRAFVSSGPSIHYLTGAPGRGPVYRSANFASLTMIVDLSGIPRSFLASEESFALVKNMHERNMIIPVVGDFGGQQALRSVAAYLKQRGTTVNAFYVSNVEQYLIRPVNKTQAFYSAVAELPLDSGSVFIRPGFAGSTGGAGATFNVGSTDSVVRAFANHWRSANITQPPPYPICPILPFLDAFRGGLVSVYADAERCAR
jgi:hypothetical protein